MARIDALVHLVGGFTGGQTVDAIPDDALEQMFTVNFRSAFHMFGAVIPHMRAQGSGVILAIGSRMAVEPAASLGAYSASKAALVSLIRTVALENKGISANVILPGTMDTPANRAAMPTADPAKWVQPSQVAALLGAPGLARRLRYYGRCHSRLRKRAVTLLGAGLRNAAQSPRAAWRRNRNGERDAVPV